jgi:transposase
MMVAETMTFVGIDVDNFMCVAVVHGRVEPFSFVPDVTGIAQLMAYSRSLPGDVRVAVEASGGTEAGLWEALDVAGFHVWQIYAAMVHAHGRSLGCLAKTDAGDAAIIAS